MAVHSVPSMHSASHPTTNVFGVRAPVGHLEPPQPKESRWHHRAFHAVEGAALVAMASGLWLLRRK